MAVAEIDVEAAGGRHVRGLGQYLIAQALLAGLGDGNAPAGRGAVPGRRSAGAEAVFSKTRVAVSRATEGEQVPTVSSSLAEDVPLKADAAIASGNAGG